MSQPNNETIPTLPQEICNKIAKSLCSRYGWTREDWKALSRLSRTCKKFRHELQHLLYTTYSHNDQPLPRLTSFLRTLIARPDLAVHVRELNLRWPPNITQLTDDDSEITFLNERIRDMGFSSALPDHWHSDDENNYCLVPYELLITHCPRLEKLSFPVHDDWRLGLVPRFSNTTPPISLSYLKVLDIGYYYIAGDRWAVDTSLWLPFLELSPNVEILGVPDCDCFWEGGNDTIPPMRCVKELNLNEWKSSEYLTTSLIHGCPNMQRFKCHWVGGTAYESADDWTFSPIWTALHQSACMTLEELTFEANEDIEIGSMTLSTLSEFTSLKKVNTDSRSLLAIYATWSESPANQHSMMHKFVSNLLPPTLRSVTISNPEHALIPVLLELAVCKSQGRYEHLTSVGIAVSSSMGHWVPSREWAFGARELKRAFAEVGVTFTVEIPHPHGGIFAPDDDKLTIFVDAMSVMNEVNAMFR